MLKRIPFTVKLLSVCGVNIGEYKLRSPTWKNHTKALVIVQRPMDCSTINQRYLTFFIPDRLCEKQSAEAVNLYHEAEFFSFPSWIICL